MKSKLIAVFASATIALSFAGTPAHAAAILAVPGSFTVGYALTGVAVADPAAPVEFVNLDIAPHNVISKAYGSDANPWCKKYGYTLGKCPLFRSDDLQTGGAGEVFGIAATKSGTTYAFFCSYHSGTMNGSLMVE